MNGFPHAAAPEPNGGSSDRRPTATPTEIEQAAIVHGLLTAEQQSAPRVSRRRFLAYGATATGALAAGGLVGAAVQREIDDAQIPPTITPQAFLDDASTLNPTAVRGVIFAGPSPSSTQELLSPLLQRISAGQDPPLVASGVRHSMGGQSLLRNGWVLDMQRLNVVELDTAGRAMRVGAGATWRDVIPVLNAAGLSPTVMQSNHDFSVGGSLSVNCHGWHTDSEPVSSTVLRLRLLTAGGDLVVCSPQENADLFQLVLGGYGMFGVILEADLAVVPNVLFSRPSFASMSTADYADSFTRRVYDPGSAVEMAYGRLSVAPESFLEEAIIATFSPVPDTRGTVLPLPAATVREVSRAVYRNSAGSVTGKSFRWWSEREAVPWLAAEISRNSVLNEPAAVYANRTRDTTDILHEYFVPQARLSEFVDRARQIIRGAAADLLNITIRDVRRDTRTVLAYAHEDVFGLVMSFVQERTDDGEARMRNMTRELVEAAIAVGGSFYLPYRLHATAEQFRRAYPAWDLAMEAKDRYDPELVFRNGLYEAYR